MARFLRIANCVDVIPVAMELQRAERLWDANPTRRTYPGTPHAAMTDITVRYMPEDAVNGTSRRAEHRNVFWPAWQALPSLRSLVFNLMARVQAVELGSIIITRLPPKGEILPHSDAGSWSAEYYNMKCHMTLAGSSLSWCEDESVRMAQGDVWTFDNLLMHSVLNDGACDRICAIVSMRCDG